MHPSLYILIAGILVGVVGGIWLLFASYKADRDQAHIAAFYVPARMIKIVLEHPKECLTPFLIQQVGLALSLIGMFMYMSHIRSFSQ
jgi:hypothetical protein